MHIETLLITFKTHHHSIIHKQDCIHFIVVIELKPSRYIDKILFNLFPFQVMNIEHAFSVRRSPSSWPSNVSLTQLQVWKFQDYISLFDLALYFFSVLTSRYFWTTILVYPESIFCQLKFLKLVQYFLFLHLNSKVYDAWGEKCTKMMHSKYNNLKADMQMYMVKHARLS